MTRGLLLAMVCISVSWAAQSSAAGFEIVDVGTLNAGLAGSRLYVPDHLTKTSSGVVLLHGSTVLKNRTLRWGGLPEILAEQGYLVFEYCYFECLGNAKLHPYSLINYDLWKTYEALVWFKSLAIFNGQFALYGLSRGAEQALLLSELMGRENLAVQPSAVILHSPIPYVWGSFDWRWVDDSYQCWKCADGGQDCFNTQLSSDDQLRRRHLKPNPLSLFKWNTSVDCGPDPRDLNLTASVSYLWKGQPIPVARQWAKVGPLPLVHLNTGHKMDPTYYRGPYMLIHGGKDLTWSPDFSKSLSLILKAYARAEGGIDQNDVRPIFSREYDDEGRSFPLTDFSNAERNEGPYVDSRTWHQFHLLKNADHAFTDEQHRKIRNQLTLEFLRNNLPSKSSR